MIRVVVRQDPVRGLGCQHCQTWFTTAPAQYLEGRPAHYRAGAACDVPGCPGRLEFRWGLKRVGAGTQESRLAVQIAA